MAQSPPLGSPQEEQFCQDDADDAEEDDDDEEDLKARLAGLGCAQASLAATQMAIALCIIVMAEESRKPNDKPNIRDFFSGVIGLVSGLIGVIGGIKKKELATRLFFIFQLWMLSTFTMYLYVGYDKEIGTTTTCAPMRTYTESGTSSDCSEGLAITRSKIFLASAGLVTALLTCLVSFDFEDALDDWSDRQKALRLSREIAAADKVLLHCAPGTSLRDNGVTLHEPTEAELVEGVQITVEIVKPGSNAAGVGVLPGMVLVEVDEIEMLTIGEVENAMHAPIGPTGNHIVAFGHPKIKKGEVARFNPADVADGLYKGMKGFGTDERTIYRELDRILTQDDWQAVLDNFRELHPTFEKGNLRKALAAELSDRELGWAKERLTRHGIEWEIPGQGGVQEDDVLGVAAARDETDPFPPPPADRSGTDPSKDAAMPAAKPAPAPPPDDKPAPAPPPTDDAARDGDAD